MTGSMTAISHSIRDWSYDEAAHRLRRSAATALPGHSAVMSLDPSGNRVATCSCRWTGNGLGWLEHIDVVVSGAVRD